MNIATLKLNPQSKKWEAIFNGHVINRSSSKDNVVRVIREGFSPKAKKFNVVDVIDETSVGTSIALNSVSSAVGQMKLSSGDNRFSINERFEFMTDLTDMIIAGAIPSLIITGEGGLGKTHTVLKSFQKAGLKNTRDALKDLDKDLDLDEDASLGDLDGDYTVIKGYSTARFLFRTLFENRNKIIIFDDTDKVLKDDVAVGILKSALDSYDERWITWGAETTAANSDLPKSFLFTGSVIFISNMTQSKIDQAVRSRSICVDLTMTTEQKIERMAFIIEQPDFFPGIDIEHKKAALDFINENQQLATEISLRTLISTLKIKTRTKVGDWTKLALYVLTTA